MQEALKQASDTLSRAIAEINHQVSGIQVKRLKLALKHLEKAWLLHEDASPEELHRLAANLHGCSSVGTDTKVLNLKIRVNSL